MTGFGRAIGGALLFSMPLLMTMEVRQLASSVDRYRLVLLTPATVALVVGPARDLGSTRNPGWGARLVDAGVAFAAAAAVAAGTVLTALHVLDRLGVRPGDVGRGDRGAGGRHRLGHPPPDGCPGLLRGSPHR